MDDARYQIKWFNESKKISQEAADEYVANTNDSGLKTYLRTIKDGEASFEGYTNHIKAANEASQEFSIKSQLASIGSSALTNGLNGLVSTLADSAINGLAGLAAGLVSGLVGMAVNKMDEYIHRNEIAIQKAKELKSEYSNFKLDNSNNISSLKDMQTEFEALSQGVDNYGNNISLSADEYARYQQIVGQVTALSPSLIEGYDAEGNAIANKNKLLERAIELQQKEAKAKLEEYTSTENLQTLLKGTQASMQEGTDGAFGSMMTNPEGEDIWAGGNFASFKGSLTALYGIDESFYDVAYDEGGKGKEFAENVLTAVGMNPDEIDEEVEKYFSKSDGLGITQFMQAYADDIAANSEKVIAAVPKGTGSNFDYWSGQFSEDAKKLADAKGEVDKANQDLQEILLTTATANEKYSSLSNEQALLVDSLFSGFDVRNLGDLDDPKVVEELKESVNGIVDAVAGDEKSQNILEKIFKLDRSSLSVEEYRNQVNSLLSELPSEVSEKLGYQEKQNFLLKLGIDDNSYNEAKREIETKFGEKIPDDIKEKLSQLPVPDLELACTLEGNFKNWDQFEQALQKAKRQSKDLEATFSDLQTPLNEVTQAQSLFAQALQEQNTQGTVSAETISALTELDEDYLKVLEDSNGQMKLNSDTFQQAVTDKLDAGKKAAQEELREALLTVRLDGTNDELEKHIAKVASLCDSYEYATSALKQWRDAQSGPDVGDLTAEGQSALNAIKEGLSSGKVGTNEYKSAENLLKISRDGKQLTGKAWTNELDAYFQDNESSVTHFLGGLSNLGELTEKTFNFKNGVTTISEIAEELGICEDFAKMLVDNARQYGYELNVQDDSMSTAVAAYQNMLEAQKNFSAMKPGDEGYDEAIKQYQEAFEILSKMPEEVQTALGIRLEKDGEVEKIIAEDNDGNSIEYELKLDADEAEEKAGELGESLEGQVTVEVSAEEKGDSFETLCTKVNELPEEVRTTYHLSVTEDGAIQYLDPDTNQTVTITAESLDDGAVEKLNGIINTKTQAETPTQFTVEANTDPAVAKLNDLQALKTRISQNISFTVRANYTGVGVPFTPPVGPAKASGTGISGVPETGSVLVGEEAPEMYVNRRTGRWQLVGMLGAEFIHAEKGDIIFNARQTRSLLNNGFAASRGKAFAKGTDEFLNFSGGRYVSHTDWSKWSRTGFRSLGGTVTLKPKVEDKDVYLADIDELYEAETRLKALQQDEEALNHALKMTDSLSEQVNLTRQLNENYRQQQAELHAANERRDELIKANVEKLRGAGFNVYYDPEQNRLMVANMEHINELMGGTQEETNALRQEYEKLISDTEKLNEANQKSSAEWLKHEEAIRKNRQEMVEKNLQGYKDFISYADDFDLWGKMDTTKVDVLRNQLIYLKQAFDQNLISLDEFTKKSREIGKEIYKEQKSALKEVIELTEDLIKKETKDRVDALNDQIDKYQEIIDLKKKALQDEADEKDYSKERDQKLKEISKLQSQISRLSLDDSREAAYERMQLEEELAEKQQELADFQEDHAREAQIDALDEEAKRFKKAKDEQIEYEESKIDTEEKLYEAAVSRIDSEGEKLKDVLISYVKEYKDAIDGENSVKTAWEAAMQAKQGYNSIKDAFPGINNEIIGGKNAPEITAKVSQMRHNSNLWQGSSKEERERLASENEDLAKMIQQLLGDSGTVFKKDGTWYFIGSSGKKELLYSIYHKGGIVGDNMDIRDDEVFAMLQKGEMVLTRAGKESLYETVDFVKEMRDRFGADISGRFAPFSPTFPSLTERYESAAREVSHLNDTVFSPTINVEFHHQGGMKDSDAVKYGNMIANTALDSLQNMFVKTGISTHRFAGFKQ